MNLTDMTEKDMILEWAKEKFQKNLQAQIFSSFGTEAETYWEMCDSESDIEEFDFDNIPEVKAILEQKLKDSYYKELVLPLAVAIFKEKQLVDIEEKATLKDRGNQEDVFTIPEFVYPF